MQPEADAISRPSPCRDSPVMCACAPGPRAHPIPGGKHLLEGRRRRPDARRARMLLTLGTAR